MIVEFRCMNNDCPYIAEAKTPCDDCDGRGMEAPWRDRQGYNHPAEPCTSCNTTGEFVDDADRFEWFGGEIAETRIDPAAYTSHECKHCGEAGEEIGRYTPREMREEMEL